MLLCQITKCLLVYSCLIFLPSWGGQKGDLTLNKIKMLPELELHDVNKTKNNLQSQSLRCIIYVLEEPLIS